MPGLWFEEGMAFEHAITRTVSEADNLLFCSMTYNPQPLHIDAHKAAATEFGRPIVNSLLTLGLLVGLSVHETTLGTTIANLGMTDVAFPAPLFHGDSLRARTTVEALRPSRSRPEAGLVTFRHEGFNQDDALVARATRTALMRRRPEPAA